MLDDDDEKGAKRAVAAKLAQRLVVALDEMEPDLGGEVVRFGGRQAVPAAHLANSRVDHGKVGEEERFVLHLRIARLWVGARIIHDLPAIHKVDGRAV